MKKVHYKSKDGTEVPMVMAYKKGMQPDGSNPTILYGYGGYGMVNTPFYSRGFMTFIQNGGIIAVPCIRGGGELGEQWHLKGSMFYKQNCFDDFIAAAEYLCNEKYTSKDMLTIMGGSNGGLLVAAVLNKRPDICKVAIAENGVYDMLRYQNFTIGSAWIKEYGSSSDRQQYNYLRQYSPLHNIKDTAYPAVLVLTGDHDDRAVPLHSYKYVAAMQQHSKGVAPVLLYTRENAGHQRNDVETDAYMYSFIFDQLGVKPSKLHWKAYY
jgi:prolyl oligopeptidase